MMDEAAAREIDDLIAALEKRDNKIYELRGIIANQQKEFGALHQKWQESERQRKDLSDRLESIIKIQGDINANLMSDLEESERQRKALAEHLEALGVEGINAATGAGR